LFELKAIILAGGIGTRLRPLSCTRPKLLFPVLNKPLLDVTLERLAKIGIDNVILAVKYMAHVFIQEYGNSKYGIAISYSIEKKPMRTGGAIKHAEKHIGHKEPFLVLNGDIFTRIDYSSILDKHKKNNAVATIALYRVKDPSRYGTVKLTKNNKITQFIEKAPLGQTPSNIINAGIYVLDPKIFNFIPAGRPVSIEHEVFPMLAAEGKLLGYEFKETWIDIGKPRDYLRVNNLLLDYEEKKEYLGNDSAINKKVEFKDPIKVDSGVTFEQNSKIGPYVVIGRDTVIGKNVCIENSVIFSSVTIADYAIISGAVIGEGAVIGKGAKINEECVIGDYAIIHDNIIISKGVTVCHSKEVRKNVTKSKSII
jgi:mannose-1-phosphate guanylyltransferase